MPKAVSNTTDSSSWGPVFNITAQKGQIVLDAAKNAGHPVDRVYGYNSSPASDHRFKQCVDFMHYGNTELREWLESFLIRNADELGIMGIISNRRCMGFPSNETNPRDCEVSWRGPEGQWRPYSGTGDPHTDHIHVQFNTASVKGAIVGAIRVKPKPHKDARAKTTRHPGQATLWTLKDVPAYDGTGRRRPAHDLKKDLSVTGHIDRDPFGDGRYLRLGKAPHRFWYPLDSNTFSHEKNGKPVKAPAQPTVSLHAIIEAAKNDPGRRQGGTTKGAEDDVRLVEKALAAEKLLAKKWSRDGSFGSMTLKAYSKWQRRLGYKGADADGIPGQDSLERLGHRHGFKVRK